jgi:thiamine-phosphate pyrophosphorylase
MLSRRLLYYITDRVAFPGNEISRRRCVLEKIAEAARCDVDFIQLREKDLSIRDLESLAREAVSIISQPRTENRELRTVFLINSRADVALAASADGVHLRSDDVSPEEVRKIWSCAAGAPARENSRRDPILGVSCHSADDVVRAETQGANFAVFAPVFEKEGTTPTGLAALREACLSKIPVLALGGVTLENAQSCLDVGAAGIAGIRLFQENDIAEVIKRLR